MRPSKNKDSLARNRNREQALLSATFGAFRLETLGKGQIAVLQVRPARLECAFPVVLFFVEYDGRVTLRVAQSEVEVVRAPAQ